MIVRTVRQCPRVSTRLALVPRCRRLATSSHLPPKEYDIDLISLKKSPKSAATEYSSSSHFSLAPVPATPASSSVVWKALNDVKHDPLIPISSPSKGLLEFVESFSVEIHQFVEFAESRSSQPLYRLHTGEAINYLYAYKELFQRGQVPSINKYNVQSHQLMVTRFLKYLGSHPKFHVLLVNQLIPIVENKQVVTDLYSKGTANFINELSALHREFNFHDIAVADLKEKISAIVGQFSYFLDDSKASASYDSHFFEIYIQVHRYKTLAAILDSVPNLSLSQLLVMLNDPDSRKINNRIKHLSGEDVALQHHVNLLSCELSFINLVFSYASFSDLFADLTRVQGDEVSQHHFNGFLDVFLPLLCNGSLANNDTDILRLTPGHDIKFTITDNLRENYEANVLAYVGLHDHIGLLHYLRLLLNENEQQPDSKTFSNFSDKHVLGVLESAITNFRGSNVVLRDLLALKNGLSYYFDHINWASHTLDKFAGDTAWVTALRLYSNLDHVSLPVNLIDTNSSVKEVIHNISLTDLKGELKLFKDSELDGLAYSHVDAYTVLEILDARITEIKRLLPSSTPLSSLTEGNVHRFEEFKARLEKWIDVNGTSMGVLDDVLSALIPEPRYKQIPDDLELEKFTTELSAFREKDLGTTYKRISATKLNVLLDQRINHVYNNLGDNLPTALNKGNVYNFIRLSKRLTRLFEANGGNTEALDILIQSQSVFSSVEEQIAEKKRLKEEKLARERESALSEQKTKPYTQIPDDLEFHKFIGELEIFRDDELKGRFADFTCDEINLLLDKRINEIHNDLPNSNPVSRMSKDNVFEFMRLSKRLTRLFDANGGHTAVLDTVVHSLNVLSDVERKIAEKKRQREAKAKEAAAKAAEEEARKNTYVQIPDDLELHSFTKELSIFRDELGGPYGLFTPEHINSVLDKRIDEAKHRDRSTSGITKDNLYDFIRMSKRLTRLFDLNGGHTAVLDTLLHNQLVFDKIQAKLSAKNANYRQIPDDFLLEEYLMELMELRAKLQVSHFRDIPHDRVLEVLKCMASDEKKYNMDKRITFMKLYRNLALLFKHNGGHAVALDNVLVNALVFSDFEGQKQRQPKVIKEVKSATGDYNDLEFILSLLTKNEPAQDEPVDLLRSKVEIKDAVATALGSEYEPKLHDTDPQEYKELAELTAEKVRASYDKPAESVKVDKNTIENYLRSAKKENQLAKEGKFRESKAYEWSKSMCNSHRLLESHNFFNPILSSRGPQGLLFPSGVERPNGDLQYLLLTINGQVIPSDENPLGKTHRTEDMFTVLNKFPKEDLAKFIKDVKKLQRKNWKLIGGGGKEKMLVFQRMKTTNSHEALRVVKTVLAASGAFFISLIGLNIMFDSPEVPDSIDEIVPQSIETSGNVTDSPAVSRLRLWKSFFWKEN